MGVQLSVDACSRTFPLRDACDVDTVRRLLSSDAVSIERLPSGLGQQLSILSLELALAGTDCFDLTSIDLSHFSVEALDELLTGGSFSIVSEDDLLKRLLSLGEKYRPLLRRIEMKFLNPTGFAALLEYLHFPLNVSTAAFPSDCTRRGIP
jgi:hypothetical protein